MPDNNIEDEDSSSREHSARQSNNQYSVIDRAATVVNRIPYVVADDDSESGELDSEISSTKQHKIHLNNHVGK